MPYVKFPNCGAVGVVKDLSKHELPINAWTDANNVRFLDGYAHWFYGHGAVYGAPPVIPYHLLPINVGAARYWLYAGAQKIYAVTVSGGAAVHTNLTRQSAGVDVNYTGTPNAWTSTSLSGIPIFNAGNTVDPPQMWDLNPANRMTTLTAWPANTFCKSLRTYKGFLVALNVTAAGVNKPFMVKWSDVAAPGAVPASWDPADATRMAGENDLAEGGDPVQDGLQLRDYFMIYKEASVWRMSFIGGQNVMSFQKVLGISGALNRNCIVEVDGFHFVLTSSDVIVHDGETARSVLDKEARRALFDDFDAAAKDRAFVFKNPYRNEVFVCYASINNSIPNKALVWNYRDNTVSYREIPALHHANYGAVDDSLADSWDSDSDSWDSDLSAWNGPGSTPNTARVLMAPNQTKLYLLDSAATFDGVKPSCYLERVGLDFGEADKIKLVRGVRPRITGNVGSTVLVKIGSQNDPYEDPVYTTMTHTIGQTVHNDCFVSGRYIAVRLESGTAYTARIDSFDLDIVLAGEYP
jgi:hypothetical protein